MVEPLIKAVDGMSDDEKQRVVLDAGRVAALADEPGQNALQNVVLNRAVFDTLEGANNRSLWVFLKEPDRFRLAEEVRYNDERRRGKSWNGFEVEKGCAVRRDPIAVAAFTKAIRDRFETPMSMSMSSTGTASSSMTRNAILSGRSLSRGAAGGHAEVRCEQHAVAQDRETSIRGGADL